MRRILFTLILFFFTGAAFGQQKIDNQVAGDVNVSDHIYQATVDSYTKEIDDSNVDKSAIGY
jgi:hypothetical protein